jgi:hypothetical protein
MLAARRKEIRWVYERHHDPGQSEGIGSQDRPAEQQTTDYRPYGYRRAQHRRPTPRQQGIGHQDKSHQ